MVYAKWASDQVADVPTVIDRVSDFLTQRLAEAEKEQLVGWVNSVTPKTERHPMFASRIERLRKKLGLVVN